MKIVMLTSKQIKFLGKNPTNSLYSKAGKVLIYIYIKKFKNFIPLKLK